MAGAEPATFAQGMQRIQETLTTSQGKQVTSAIDKTEAECNAEAMSIINEIVVNKASDAVACADLIHAERPATDSNGNPLTVAPLIQDDLIQHVGTRIYIFVGKLRPNKLGDYNNKCCKDILFRNIVKIILERLAKRHGHAFTEELVNACYAEDDAVLSAEGRSRKLHRNYKRSSRKTRVEQGHIYA